MGRKPDSCYFMANYLGYKLRGIINGSYRPYGYITKQEKTTASYMWICKSPADGSCVSICCLSRQIGGQNQSFYCL